MLRNESQDISDHCSYLSKKLWNFCSNSEFTDVTLVCADGKVQAHRAMLSNVLKSFHINLKSQEFECIIIPDVMKKEVEIALKELYSKSNMHCLNEAIGNVNLIKIEPDDSRDLFDTNIILDDAVEKEEKDDEKHKVEPNQLKDIEMYAEQLEIQTSGEKTKTVTRNNKFKKCNSCYEIFNNGMELKKHMSSSVCGGKSTQELNAIEANLEIMEEKMVENKKTWFCKVCNFSKSNKPFVLEHCTKHTKQYYNQCYQCYELFRDKVTLRNHKNHKHLGVKMYSCECGVKFASRSGLSKHRLSHNEIQQHFECNNCDYVTSDKNRLKRHVLRIHEKINRFPCEICGKLFFTSAEATDHTSRLHSSEHPFECQVCNKNFSEQRFLDQHIRIVHLTVDDEPQECTECGNTLKGIQNLRKHVKHMHSPESIKPFACSQCGKGFFDKNKYKTHLNMHTGVKNFSCTECGNLFSEESALKRHIRIHAGTNKFKCDLCDKTFTQQYDVTRHKLKVHVDNII